MQSIDQVTPTSNASRLGGWFGLAFAAFVILQNAVLLVGNPMPNASLADIQDFYETGSGRISIAVGLVALNVLLLIGFGATATKRLERAAAAVVPARAAFAGIIVLAGAFLTTTLLQAVLVTRVDQLVAADQLQLLWDIHTAAFAMSATGLGVTLAGLSYGALVAGDLVPRWTAYLGLVGAVCVIGGGMLVVGTLDGGPGIWLQLTGFATWLIWLVTASVRLIREPAS